MSENGKITHRLIITIPGAEKKEVSFHPNETVAREHLRTRLKPESLHAAPKLPSGSEWVLLALTEEQVAKGVVP